MKQDFISFINFKTGAVLIFCGLTLFGVRMLGDATKSFTLPSFFDRFGGYLVGVGFVCIIITLLRMFAAKARK